MERKFVKSRNIDIFIHFGEIYIYHNLFGFNLKMSSDLLRILDAFETPREIDEVKEELSYFFVEDDLNEFIQTFLGYSCLIPEDYDEESLLWDMFPVKAAWIVSFEKTKSESVVYNCIRERCFKLEFKGWKKMVWDLCTGNEALSDIFEEVSKKHKLTKQKLIEFIKKLVHSDFQFLRMSDSAMEKFVPVVFPVPMYLKSTMPFRKFDRKKDLFTIPLSKRRVISPEKYYQEEISDTKQQFDVVETTLSHLFYVKHPALNNRSYGEALFDKLVSMNKITDKTEEVLEIGGGTGYVLKEFLKRNNKIKCEIADISTKLNKFKKDVLKDYKDRIHFTESDILKVDFEKERFDIVISNEMIGDLEVLRLANFELEKVSKLEIDDDMKELLERIVPIIKKHDPPDLFYVNIGAIKLVEKIYGWLKKGGVAYISEFGDRNRFPLLSDHLDHPEFSIHFGILEDFARSIGFKTEYHEVLDFLSFKRNIKILSTTRGHYLSLQKFFKERGVKFPKIAWTEEMLKEHLGEKQYLLKKLSNIKFEELERRCMGLAPTDFKCLILTKE